MLNFSIYFLRSILVVYLSVFLSACGGGGGDGGVSEGNIDTPAQAESLGYIYYANDRDIIRHEVSTGSNTIHVKNDFRFGHSATASADSTLFSVLDDGNLVFDVLNARSNNLKRISTPNGEKFSAPIEFSPNNKYFMVLRYGYFTNNRNFAELDIYSFDTLISHINYPISGYDWLNNDEIIFIVGDSIYRQRLSNEGQISGQPELVYQFAGEPLWGLSASPNGNQIAVIKRGLSVHVIDVDGGGDRHIASILSNPDDDITGLNAVRWSPDGNYIAVATRALDINAYAQGCSVIATMPAVPEAVVDIGSKANWLAKADSSGSSYVCVGDLHSFSWRRQ